MDKEFFEDKEGCEERVIKREDAINDIKSKGPEATQAETKEMLEEVTSVMSFVKDRITEITNKHQSLCAVGALGYISAVSFCGKPVAFAGIGTKKALDNTLKVVMMGVMNNED